MSVIATDRQTGEEKKGDKMYKSAIVDELGWVMFWCDELQDEAQIECILNGHPEWRIELIEQ